MQKNSVVKEEYGRFWRYLYDIRWYLVVCGLIYVAIYAPWMQNIYPRIDTEAMLNTPYSTYNWLIIGRQGMVLTKLLSRLMWYNPFAEYCLGYAALFVSIALFGFLFWRVGGGAPAACTAMLLAVISPIMTEQLYFELQLFEIGLAYCLCALAVMAAFYGIRHKDLRFEGLSILLMIWIFSSYQVFIILYIAAVVLSFILLYTNWTIAGKRHADGSVYLRMVGRHILLFMLSFLANTVITKVFFSSDSGNSYLGGYVAWGKEDTVLLLRNLAWSIFSSLTGKEFYYTIFYGIFAVTSVLIAAASVARRKEYPVRWLFLLAVVGLQILPFVMTIAFGAPPAIRVQIAYPFVLACNVIFVICAGRTWRWKKVICGAAAVCAFICLWTQCLVTQRMVYTDVIRGQEDLRVASAIEERIGEESDLSKPIAFVGIYRNNLNAACLRGQYVGTSILSVDDVAQPYYFFSSGRICSLFQMMGFHFSSVSPEQMLEARKTALQMPCWPAQGSVVDAGDYTIVKLSEDRWASELVGAEANPAEPPLTDGTVRYAVESLHQTGEHLAVTGWAVVEGTPSEELFPRIYLQDSESGECYQLNSYKEFRPYLEMAFPNGGMYVNAGFGAIIPEHLTSRLDEMDLIIGCYSEEEQTLHASVADPEWASAVNSQ